ncbi:uncharacterized protein LOC131003182 [Salvia miltiorrhiza]|uniref:uncharacterized protein LOC131003182 n=1 Tax=Salvia miltiorrhiza TaxID=226208 RepID=UPI0025AC8DE8|nr:uncharacterized protein LOC131003182 [Salvia miltiorrhiza]
MVSKTVLCLSKQPHPAGVGAASFLPPVDQSRFIPGIQNSEAPSIRVPSNPKLKAHDIPTKNFKAAVQGKRIPKSPEVFIHDLNLVHPIMSNGQRCVEMPEALYQERMRGYTYALHARLMLRKGDLPRFAADIHEELSSIWELSLPFRVIPLGRGFFSLILSSMDDYSKARLHPSLKLRHGVLSIKDWSPKFDPYKQNSSLIQVWTRIYYLPHEFWHPELLTSIARAIGTPIKMDGPTFNGEVGHFARILIEIDVSKELTYTIPVSRGFECFDVELSYENLPYFCGICHAVGHSSTHCRRKPEEQALAEESVGALGKEDGKGDGFVQKKKKPFLQTWKNTGSHGNLNPQQMVGQASKSGLPSQTIFQTSGGHSGFGNPANEHAKDSSENDSVLSRNAFEVLEGVIVDNEMEENMDPASNLAQSFPQTPGGQTSGAPAVLQQPVSETQNTAEESRPRSATPKAVGRQEDPLVDTSTSNTLVPEGVAEDMDNGDNMEDPLGRSVATSPPRQSMDTTTDTPSPDLALVVST